ncbi:glycosyltransferase [Arcticibacter eurypsychrophilus]|uniref:glycosyltransferase n=1 Tax=Arcticibacter eurypsychrophilus TaxID=1434752 RepID=UPI00084DC116|nr:glycosyltransferase [Arcticibacter eurypsychrophilus]
MKKKVFFIVSHLRAGGSERVFWLLSQYLDKSFYEVSLVLLDSRNSFFSADIDGVNVINLNSIRASNSFFKLRSLIKAVRPYAIFTTGGHINTLLSFVSLFAPVPVLIGRESNVMNMTAKLGGPKEKFWDLFVRLTYFRFKVAVCQSNEIHDAMANLYHIPMHKLVVIPNPVLLTSLQKVEKVRAGKKLILVARLAIEKGIIRLLHIIKKLPVDYTLTIAGEGPMKEAIKKEISLLQLGERVHVVGLIPDILNTIVNHDLMVLTSLTEGFPNVVLESLSVGIPVVAFRVSGISEMLRNDFNGYIINQDDMDCFASHVVKACNRKWDSLSIKEDVNNRFGVEKVVKQYEKLLL